MSDTLTVPTHFAEISEFAEGFIDRVDEERLILYGPDPYDEGIEIPFAVLLVDGSPALQGRARVAASVDGGEERTSETRYDIVLDSLQLDGHSEVVYERVLVSRNSAVRGDPVTGEVNLNDVEQVEEGAPPDFQEDSTVVAEYGDSSSGPEPGGVSGAQVFESADVESGAPDGSEPAPADVDEVPAVGDPEAEPAFGEADVPQRGHAEFDAAVAATQVGPVDSAGYDEQPPVEEPPAAQVEPEPSEPAVDPWAGAETTGEVGLGEMEEVAPREDLLGEATTAGAVPHGGEAVAPVAEPAEAPPSKPPPEPPRAPGGFAVGGVGANGSALSRPSYERSWMPAAAPPPEPEQSSGLFPHTGGLPIPPRAPRPNLDPSLRVRPAPAPAEGGEMEAPGGFAEPTPPDAVDADGMDAPASEPPVDDLTDAVDVSGEVGALEEAWEQEPVAGEATHHQVAVPPDEPEDENPGS